MLQTFLLNLLLALIWVALTGQLNYVNFGFGFILAFFILWFLNRQKKGTTSYFTRVPKIISFFISFFIDMLKANIQVSLDVITPRHYMKPGVIKYEMDAVTDFEIMMFANTIALTPGTLVLDISKDKKHMYIHVMYLKDIEKFKRNMKVRTERKLLEILR
ncbi:Na+/H+ antiporter subunit E [Capnocytophaga sp. ARDL2]|uniref:Na+/H+ antiporter subunit E n=1 Tax=Capnocytophaga sp. ARDL2 TaxID=3238809 RepID=UPI003557DDA1